MTNDERAQLEILRAEMNGKLDLLLERTADLKDTTKDHEVRIRDIEEHGSTHATEAAKNAIAAKDAVGSLKTRIAVFSGVIAAFVFLANLVGPVILKAVFGIN